MGGREVGTQRERCIEEAEARKEQEMMKGLRRRFPIQMDGGWVGGAGEEYR